MYILVLVGSRLSVSVSRLVTLVWLSTVFSTKVHLPLSAGKMAMFWSHLGDSRPFLSSVVRLGGGATSALAVNLLFSDG